jgi:Predicted Zn-ribbon RNA-binding protein
MIRRCAVCKRYTIKEQCPNCGSKELVSIHPPKFSPNDKYLMVKFYAILERKKRKTD